LEDVTMQRIYLFGVTIASAIFFATASLAASTSVQKPDPWIGMWDLNPAKSRIRPANLPRSNTRIFIAAPDGEKATYHGVDAQGRAYHTASIYKLDGTEARITGQDLEETLSFIRVDSHTLAFVGKEKGKIVRTGTRAVSKDGNVLTVTVKGSDASGKPTEDVWVLDRRVAKTAADALQSALQFHDPQNKWKEFNGQVRLVTNYTATGANMGEEILEFRNAEGYYKRTSSRGGESSIQGIERGAVFRSASGADASAKKQTRLNDEAIKGMSQHHRAHVGFVMAIAGSGLQLARSAEQAEFHGRPVHALTFSRTSKISHPYWNADHIVYLDRDTFALCGYRITSGDRSGMSVAVLGDLDIGGIRIPRTKVYYGATGAYQFTDLFTRP
jgi:hypothetical protein